MPHAASRAPLLARLLAVVGMLALLLPGLAPRLGAQELDEVERQVDQLDQQLTAATQRWGEVRAKVEAARTELQGLRDRAADLEVLNGRDRAQLQQALALRTHLDQTERLITDRVAALDALEAQLDGQRTILVAQLGQKKALAADLRARAAVGRTQPRGQ